jgi:hypothetical protein
VLEPPPLLICVIDSSFLIKIKQLVKVDEQWTLLAWMMVQTEVGVICFPRQVAAEMVFGKHPDAPGAWAGHAKSLVCHREPGDGCVAAVLALTPDLIDADATGAEPADPYVVGMAIDLATVYPECRIVVVSDDKVDRMPIKRSLKTACDRMSVEFWEPSEFLTWAREQIAAQGS